MSLHGSHQLFLQSLMSRPYVTKDQASDLFARATERLARAFHCALFILIHSYAILSFLTLHAISSLRCISTGPGQVNDLSLFIGEINVQLQTLSMMVCCRQSL